jgi:hypothetical protein
MAALDYFSLSNREGDVAARSAIAWMPAADTVSMYVATVVGVVLSNGVAQAQKGAAIALNLNWTWVLIASVIALMLFPQVWAKVGARADANWLVRAGIAVQSGAFFAVLMTAAQKAAGA